MSSALDMALKKEPKDTDVESFFGTDSHSRSHSPPQSSPYSDTASSAVSTPLPVHFLGDQGGCEMMLDPLQEEVVFLPHRGSSGQALQNRLQGVTEYANYTISHLEAEVNSKHLPKKYRCRFCVYKTSYKSDLNRHLKKHGIALQHCPLCNMPFKTAGNLENHIGQAHSDIVRNVGNLSSPSATLSPPQALASEGRVDTPPATAMDLHTDSDVAVSVEHPDHDQQTVQYGKDFPVLSNALHSPHQLHCHMCPFVSNDAQVLARHILTHPGEEEASRTSHGAEHNLAVPGLMCSVCGETLPSAEEFHEHRHSCVDSEIPEHGKGVWSLNSDREEAGKQGSLGEKEASGRLGLPRQETMDRLKRALTHQTISTEDQACSASKQTFRPRRDKTTMMLPHVPAAEAVSAAADQSERESVSDHQASVSSPRVEAGNEEGIDVMRATVDSSVPGGNLKDQTRNPDGTVGRQLSADACRVTSAEFVSAEQHAETSSGDPFASDYSHLSKTRSQKRQQSGALSSQHFQSTRTLRSAHASFTKKGSKNQKEVDHSEKMSGKRLLTRVDSRKTCFDSSKNTKARSLFACNTISIKEEPDSPDVSTDPEESENTCETDSKSSPGTIGPDLASGALRSDTRQRVCDFGGPLFSNRSQFLRHRHGTHTRASEPTYSSGRPNRNTSNQRHKASTRRTTVPRSEDGCMLPESQDLPPSGCSLCHGHSTTGNSTQRQFFQQRVVCQPPSSRRYAVLVSDFDEFASKPFACSLCFFRTAHLSELSAHVHNHLTGGSAGGPPSASAGFQLKEPLLVGRGTSPLKMDSDNGLGVESVSVPDTVSSSAISTSCETLSAPRTSHQQSTRLQFGTAGLLDRTASAEEVDQRYSGDVNNQSSVSSAVGNSVPTSSITTSTHTAEAANSTTETTRQHGSFQTPEGFRLEPSSEKDEQNKERVSDSLNQQESSNKSKHSEKLADRESELHSAKTRTGKRRLVKAKVSPNSPHGESVPYVGYQAEHDTQEALAETKVRQGIIPAASHQKLCPGKNKKHIILKQKNRSSKKVPRKKSQLHVPDPERNRKDKAKMKSRHTVRRMTNVMKRGFLRTAVTAPSYSCDLCQHSFSLRPLLVRHMRYIHLVSANSPKKRII